MPGDPIGVVGAGALGSEIALAAALAGRDVVLRDVDAHRVQAGIAHAQRVAEGLLRRGKVAGDAADVERRIAHITPSVRDVDLRRCAVVIEAVPERLDVKERVFTELGRALDHDAVLASTTANPSITALGRAAGRERTTIGLHFFTPPATMRLVEVVRGERTGSTTVMHALDVLRDMDKTAVVVKECPGFIVNRVLTRAACVAYRETLRRDADLAGVDAEIVRDGQAPVGPFALGDVVGLGVMARLRDDLIRAYGDRFWDDGVLDPYVRAGRVGGAAAAGFFEGPVTPRPHVGAAERAVARAFYDAARDEARRCVADSVAAPDDVTTAMKLGAGWAGGPFSP